MQNGWYYSKAGQTLGPITIDQLRSMIASAQVTPQDPVWHESMPQWAPAGQVQALGVAAAPAQQQQQQWASGQSQYQPQNLGYATPGHSGGGALSPLGANALGTAGGWARYVSITLLIISGLYLFFIIYLMTQVRGSRADDAIPILLGGIVGVILLGIAGFLLNAFASRAGEAARMRDGRSLDRALEANRTYWVYTGVLTIIYSVILLIAFVAGMANNM